MWWKPDFETLLYPYLSPNVKKPKVYQLFLYKGLSLSSEQYQMQQVLMFLYLQECTKLYLVKLPESRKFIVPKNLKLLAVPLCQIHENHKVTELLYQESNNSTSCSICKEEYQKCSFILMLKMKYCLIKKRIFFKICIVVLLLDLVLVIIKKWFSWFFLCCLMQTYGPIISGVPQLLSKFSYNVIET